MKTRNSHHFWSCNVTTSTREPTTRAWISADIWRHDGAICSKNRKIVPYHGSARIPRLTVSVPDYGSWYRSMTSGSSLKLYLNSLVYHRNIFGSSSIVFGNLRNYSDIFRNFRKFSENVRERSSGLQNNFGKSLEIFGKWSEIFGKSSKTPSSVCLYNKKNITR